MRAKLAKCERAALGQPSSSCDSTRAPSRIARSPDLTRRQSITTACAVNAQPQPGIRICRASSRRSVLMPCRHRDRRWSPPRRQGLGKSREGVACQIGRHLDLQRPRPPRETDSPLEGTRFEPSVPPSEGLRLSKLPRPIRQFPLREQNQFLRNRNRRSLSAMPTKNL